VELHGDELWTGYSCVGSLLRMMHCAFRDREVQAAVRPPRSPLLIQCNWTALPLWNQLLISCDWVLDCLCTGL